MACHSEPGSDAAACFSSNDNQGATLHAPLFSLFTINITVKGIEHEAIFSDTFHHVTKNVLKIKQFFGLYSGVACLNSIM